MSIVLPTMEKISRKKPNLSSKAGNAVPEAHSDALLTVSLPRPFGRLLVRYRNAKVKEVTLLRRTGKRLPHKRLSAAEATRDKELERKLRADFQAYFSGRKVNFDFETHTQGCTPFQKAVWTAMRQIPYGQTRSYRWLAEKIGKPRAFRAVGNACGKNPLLIIQPCHRVIGSGGKLGGFGAGLDLKRALLRLEGASFNERQ